MSNRFDLPAPADHEAYATLFDKIEVALREGGLEVDEAIDLARLWHRLQPVLNGWLAQLNRQAEQTLQYDLTLRKLWRRGISLVGGQLRELAAEAFQGSPLFPVIVRSGQ